jgi:outer membrane protein assembly factor BamB
MLDSGNYVIASANSLAGGPQEGEAQWRIETDGVVIGLAALSDDRVVAHTRNGQVMTLQHGRYSALWQVDGLDEGFVALGETLVFVTTGGGLEAYDPAGTALWSLESDNSEARVSQFVGSNQQIALGVWDRGEVLWRLIDGEGQVNFEARFDDQPLVVPAADGSWLGLDGSIFKRFAEGSNHSYQSIGIQPGRTAAGAVDALGNSYFYLGDSAGTLIALGPTGEIRWRIEYESPGALTPLLSTGTGCVLYALDAEGRLSLFNTADGALVHEIQLYPGGDRSSSPRARLLTVDRSERILASSGFLTTVTLDGWALAAETMQDCRLG